MHQAHIGLENARRWTNYFCNKNHGQTEIRWCLGEETTKNNGPGAQPGVPSLVNEWHPDAFWIPPHEPHGFPSFHLLQPARLQDFEQAIKDYDLDAIIVTTQQQLHTNIFKRITFYVGDTIPGIRSFNVNSEPFLPLFAWLSAPSPVVRTNHCDAFVKYVNFPLGRNEDVWGYLGAWAWTELESLLGQITLPERALDAARFRRLCSALDKGEIVKALALFDAFCPRDLRYKRRHYFDVCTLYVRAAEVWEKEGQGRLFRRTAKATLYQALHAGMEYERMYLTFFGIWLGPYWQALCKYFLSSNLLYSTEEQYRAICKETTAQVTASWFFPLTNRQHIASAYFLNAEDWLGFSDTVSPDHSIALEIVEMAIDDFEYTFPDGSERTFDAYLNAFSTAAYSLMEPIYRKYGATVLDKDHVTKTRTAWGSGGVAGRRSRDVFGSETAPAGSSKAYVFNKTKGSDYEHSWGGTWVELAQKVDERGRVARTLAATDMRDQYLEKVCFRPITNKYPTVGLDIGESPLQTLTRHVQLVGASRRPWGYTKDGQVLVAWDWSKWDHFYHNSEKVIVLQQMKALTSKYVPGTIGAQMELDLDDLIEQHMVMTFRSRDFADKHYGTMLDEMIAANPGRMHRVAGKAGEFAVTIQRPNGQQSGKFTTLDSNTLVGTSRLLVRDAELMGKTPSLQHRTALYTLNRADDVAEIFACYSDGVAAVSKMIGQGHRANPKKQVLQYGSIVYFRILYCGGAMRAFPPRSVYAAATGHPDKGAGSEAAFYDKLKSVSSGLDMWMRRGGWYGMAAALYKDAEAFFSKTRVWDIKPDGTRKATRITVPKEVLRASPLHSGLGILPPGTYTYDYTIKCTFSNRFKAVARKWDELVDKAIKKNVGPGTHDLEGVAAEWLTKATTIVPDENEVRRFKRKWAAARVHQDGQGHTRVYERNARMARCVRRWHRDKRDDSYQLRGVLELARKYVATLANAIDLAQHFPGSEDVGRYIHSNFKSMPASGMIMHQWHGYGEVVLSRADDVATQESLLNKMAHGSSLGLEFWGRASRWSLRAKKDHMLGKVGPQGGWDKLIPPSFAGWLKSTVLIILEVLAYHMPDITHGVYRFHKTLAEITSIVALCFSQSFPKLCVH